MADDEEHAVAAKSGSGLAKGRSSRASSRVPPVIEGRATEVAAAKNASQAPNPPPEEQVASDTPGVSLESADAPLEHEVPLAPPPDGPVRDDPMPAEPAVVNEAALRNSTGADTPAETQGSPGVDVPLEADKRKRGRLSFALPLAILVLGGAAAAWLFADGGWPMIADRLGLQDTPTRTDAVAVKPTQTPPSPPSSASPLPPQAPRPTPTVATAVTTAPPAPTATPVAPSTASSSSLSTPSALPPTSPAASLADARKPDVASSAPPIVSASTAASPATSEARLGDLDRKIAALDTRIATLSAAPVRAAPETSAAIGTQSGRLDRIDATLGSIEKRLASLETQLTPKSEARASQVPDVPARDTGNASARIVVAQGLIAAVSNGAPFAAQIAALRSLGVEDSSLQRLAGAAESGIPTVAMLRESFTKVRERLRPTPVKSDADATWSDKMRARFASLVTVRPASERAGPSSEAIASRVDAALARGDVAAAVNEARTFPPSDAALVKDWLDASNKRTNADADARGILATALAVLAKPKS